jgi:hypothetical protein
MTMKGKRFKSIQLIEAATTAQLKTLTKENFRKASERGKNDGISVFEARGSILRGINGNVSFTVIIFFYLNIRRIFITSRIMCVCSVCMRFAAARYLLALIMEVSVRSSGPAHVLDNTPLTPLLENSHFYIVVVDDRVQSFSLRRFKRSEHVYSSCLLCSVTVLCFRRLSTSCLNL